MLRMDSVLPIEALLSWRAVTHKKAPVVPNYGGISFLHKQCYLLIGYRRAIHDLFYDLWIEQG